MRPVRLPDEANEDGGDCMMTLENFLECVNEGYLIDYDGYGAFATETEVSDDEKHLVKPSDTLTNEWAERPTWATHICWYNR